MDKGYIAPKPALRKLRAANGLGQVYIYGATGYGKTELVKQYLSKRRYRYISSAEDAAGLLDVAAQGGRKGKGAETRTVVVVDDLHLLKDQEGRRAVLSLIKREDVWPILICRSPIPAWLMPPYVGGGFLVITEDDLRLGEKEAAAYMESQGLSITKEELAFVVQRSRGTPISCAMPPLRCWKACAPARRWRKKSWRLLPHTWKAM